MIYNSSNKPMCDVDYDGPDMYDPNDDDYAYLDDYEIGRRDEYYDARSEDMKCYPQDYDYDE